MYNCVLKFNFHAINNLNLDQEYTDNFENKQQPYFWIYNAYEPDSHFQNRPYALCLYLLF